VVADWQDVFYHTFVPTLNFTSNQLLLLCAILGTTISPYLFFWQTSQEVEDEILHGETSIEKRRRSTTPEQIRRMRIDVWSGMAFSNMTTFFIFAACAGTLFVHGVTDVTTADQAALALKSFGDFAFLFFALGIVGTGMLAVPVLAGSTAYAMAESFGWRYGLYRKWKQASAFYGVIIVSMILGIIANFLRLDPIKGLIYAAAVNGMIAPVVLYFVVRISGNKHVMGMYTNGRVVTIIGWATIAVMAVSGIAALWVIIM
jgi:Mn2+/Fe2+ NRAMP family transporter